MLLKGNLFDKAFNRKLNLKVAKLPSSLKFHHDLDQFNHAQQKEYSKDLKIVNAEWAVESVRPIIIWVMNYI